ncbi:universal stress protein [Candidatus Nitrosocosmicus hydrocola]|uniref:universal stress protein n=1 Tax=Candidatus Nitrosocosmicus hydrocola TaxID=1826872 RepID=UPI0011E5AA14|nr:universal stress protein [Candidatus Nitrosocosmicus hydrocola]
MTTNASAENKKISNMLVAIDGSEYSFKAAEYALDLAKLYGSKLFAVTVTYLPTQDKLTQKQVLDKGLVEDESVAGETSSEKWFDSFLQKAASMGVDVKPELINSTRPVDYVLLEFAEGQNIDLIVVGTRGRTGFKKLLLGSTATSIVTYAHCPVLVVK